MGRSLGRKRAALHKRVASIPSLEDPAEDPLLVGYADLLLSAWREAAADVLAGGASIQENPFASYAGREFEFCREQFVRADGRAKAYWDGQRAVVERLVEKRRVAVRSCRKGGKTEIEADAILAFVQTSPTIVVSTASGGRQVETGLWSRVNAQFSRTRTRLVGECLKTRLDVAPNWYAIGFSTNDSTKFQGFHAGVDFPDDPSTDRTPEEVADAIERAAREVGKKSSVTRLLLVFDEAFGIDQAIFDAAKGSMLGENVYALACGNPTREFEEPHESCRMHRGGSRWWRIVFDTKPDVDDPVGFDERFVVPQYLSDGNALNAEYPVDDPLHRPMVRGQFMVGGAANRVIPYEILKAAAEPRDTNLKRGAHIGFDTAWKGDDSNVAVLFFDSVLVSIDSWHGQDTIATWERLKMLRGHWAAQIGVDIPWRHVHIDAAPVAAGIIDTAAREGCRLDSVNFGGSPTGAWREHVGKAQFKNRRAEMYWVLRELLRKGMASIPSKYERVWQELATTQYGYASGTDQIALEPKEKIRERLGKSPDFADAAVLAFCQSPGVIAFRM